MVGRPVGVVTVEVVVLFPALALRRAVEGRGERWWLWRWWRVVFWWR